jgi:hypothetical protein
MHGLNGLMCLISLRVITCPSLCTLNHHSLHILIRLSLHILIRLSLHILIRLSCSLLLLAQFVLLQFNQRKMNHSRQHGPLLSYHHALMLRLSSTNIISKLRYSLPGISA